MDPDVALASAQLARMRGMTGYYHRRFFADTRFTLVVGLGIVVAAAAIDERLVALLAPVALLGAAQTAFDASYLTFARQYARALEGWLNERVGTDILVAADLEEAYLYPLDRRKIVTVPFDRAPTWFSTMTLLYTLFGIAAYALGVWGTWSVFGGGREARLYVAILGVVTVVVLGLGVVWFVTGSGERKLRDVLDPVFGAPE
jgi:hypothetical protein